MLPLIKSVSFALPLAIFGLSAQAGVVFSNGNIGGGDNVVFNPCNPSANFGPQAIVEGCLNGSQPTPRVLLSGFEPLTVNGGQAKVEAQDGLFRYLQIDMADPSLNLTTVGFNINTPNGGNANNTGDILIIANLVGGGSTISTPFAVANGQNAFTVSTTAGTLIDSVILRSVNTGDDVDFLDVRQVRLEIAGAQNGSVPVPGVAALLGIGLLGFAASKRRRT